MRHKSMNICLVSASDVMWRFVMAHFAFPTNIDFAADDTQGLYSQKRESTSGYCWFSHDVTKTQTTKLSILLIFYFHNVLEQLKTNFQTNFRFKRVHGFVIEHA